MSKSNSLSRSYSENALYQFNNRKNIHDIHTRVLVNLKNLLNSYYNSYRDCRDVFHQTKGLSSEKFCSYCGVRKTISPKSQSKTRCVICLAKKAEYVFIPCGHLCCCKD